MKIIQITLKQFCIVFIVCFCSFLGYGQGVELVKDINPGPDSSDPYNYMEQNGLLYFVAHHEDYGYEPWVTDGTEAGTHLIKDINPTDPYDISIFTAYNGKLYFSADDGIHGQELWVTDGTESGTFILKDINVHGGIDADSYPGSFFRFNGLLYFTADDGIHGRELWVTDGTVAGTQLVHDINPGAGSSNPIYFIEYNGNIYFNADDGLHGQELWVTNGTAAGTSLAVDIRQGGIGSNPFVFGVYNNMLYLTVNDGTIGRELWLSDGTLSGTAILKDINPGAASSDPTNFQNVNGKLVFYANDGTHGTELWGTDGTEAGTILLQDINPGSGSSSLGRFGILNDKVYFSAHDGSGIKMWRSDGTPAGTEQFSALPPSGEMTPNYYFINYADKLYFYSSGKIGATDGTQAGTTLLTQLTPDLGFVQFRMYVFDGYLYFRAMYDPAVGVELYKYRDPDLSIDDHDFSAISIYPNPTNDILFINSKSLIDKIQIFDTHGRMIKEEFPDRFPLQMNTQSLKSGVYFVNITAQGRKSIHKVIKK